VKPIANFASRWQEILNRVIAKAETSEFATEIIVIGGGAGGVELCFAMHQRLHKELQTIGKDVNSFKMSLVSRSSTLMPSHNRCYKYHCAFYIERQLYKISKIIGIIE